MLRPRRDFRLHRRSRACGRCAGRARRRSRSKQTARCTPDAPGSAIETAPRHGCPRQQAANGRGGFEPPRTGVELVDSQERDGVIYHSLRDLRNGNLINNVTRSSARRLWHYAITQVENSPPDLTSAHWRNNVAVISRRHKGNMTLYDLAVREGDKVHIYYGVTEGGLSDAMLGLIGDQVHE